MVRNNIYCFYNGKEFRFVHNNDGTYEIVTTDKSIMDDSFTLYRNEVYTKKVELNEIEEIYSITTFAVYNGDVFGVSRTLGDNVELYTTNVDLAEENKMDTMGKNEFVKIVPKTDIEVFEEKKLLTIT